MSHLFLNPAYDPIALALMFLAGIMGGWVLRGLYHAFARWVRDRAQAALEKEPKQ